MGRRGFKHAKIVERIARNTKRQTKRRTEGPTDKQIFRTTDRNDRESAGKNGQWIKGGLRRKDAMNGMEMKASESHLQSHCNFNLNIK